jgi:tRNA(Ile)-lysidine synthase
LKSTPWLAPERLAAAAANLAEAESALVWMTDRLFAAKAKPQDGGFAVDAVDLPAELQRRLVREAIWRLGGEAAPGPKLGALLDTLRAGGTATLAGIKCVGGTTWRFQPAPPRRSG